MVSSTGGFLRWQTADDQLYECSRDGSCRTATGVGIIGPRPERFDRDSGTNGKRFFALADLLDDNLSTGTNTRTLHFADGELRTLPETIANDWTDNLVGAQYLDFPEGSTVRVEIGLQAVSAPPDGLLLKLILRQFEQEVTSVLTPTFPLLQTGQSCRLSFSFNNDQARQAFSFHLLGAGHNARIQLDTFDVTVTSGG